MKKFLFFILCVNCILITSLTRAAGDNTERRLQSLHEKCNTLRSDCCDFAKQASQFVDRTVSAEDWLANSIFINKKISNDLFDQQERQTLNLKTKFAAQELQILNLNTKLNATSAAAQEQRVSNLEKRVEWLAKANSALCGGLIACLGLLLWTTQKQSNTI